MVKKKTQSTKRRLKSRYGKAGLYRPRLTSRVFNGFVKTKLRANAVLTSSAAGEIQFYISDSAPNAWLNGASSLADWSSYAALYDQFKVYRIDIRYSPIYNVSDIGNTFTFAPLFMVHDPDTGNSNIAQSAMLDYNKLCIKNMARPWFQSFYISRKRTGGAAVNTQTSPGWFDVANPVYCGVIAAATAANPLFKANTTYGIMIVTYHMGFKNRR